MANIILKDKNGTDITHMGIDYLCMRTLEGGLVRFNEGDIRVISVDELPSENIKEDAIYKVSAIDEDGNAKVVFYTYVDGEWTEYKVGKDPVFENLEITENGTYTPAEGVDGWSEVTVNVESNPVLTELVVTENGVYDEPVIAGAPDFSVGKTVQFKESITMDDIPENIRPTITGQPILQTFATTSDGRTWMWMAMPVGDLGYGIAVSGNFINDQTKESFSYIDDLVASTQGAQQGITEAGWYQGASDTMEPMGEPPSLIIENETMSESLASWPFLFVDSSTPADGWNKVTVNVAGDIIDVPELPTENIEEGKIYRVVKNTEESVVVWVVGMSNGEKKVEPFGDFLLAQGGMPNGAQVHYGFIESLDQDPPKPNDETFMNTHIWVLRETGIPYMYFEGSYMDLGTALEADISICKGYIDDPYMAPGGGLDFYSVHTPAESSTTYGIPDEADNKTVMEHNGSEWVECGAGSGSGGDNTVIDVESLPTENVDDSKIYRINEEKEPVIYIAGMNNGSPMIMPFADMYAQFGVTMIVPVYVVDTLPDTMETMDQSTMTIPCYVLESTGVAYMSEDGTPATAQALGAAMGGADGGWVNSVDEIVPTATTTFYTIRGGSFINYGVPNDNNNKAVYEYTAENGWVDGKKALRDSLQGEIDSLQGEIDSLTESNATLTTEKEHLANQNDELTERIENIFNIAYGDVEPTDTSKLWVQTNEPSDVIISSIASYKDGAASVLDTTMLNVLDGFDGCDGVVVSGKVYFYDSGSGYNMHCFDPATSTVTLVDALSSVSLYGACCAAVGMKIYIFKSNKINCFDTETGTYEPVSYNSTDFSYNNAYRMRCAAVGTKIYIFGGYGSSWNTRDTWCFDTETNEIRRATSAPDYHKERAFGIAVVGDDIYISINRSLYCFDTKLETYSEILMRLQTNDNLFGDFAAIGSTIYLFGLNAIYAYDTNTKTATKLNNALKHDCRWGLTLNIDDKIYLFGGGSTAHNKIQCFYPFEKTLLIEENKLQIVPSLEENIFRLTNEEDKVVEIGVDRVYKGNSYGEGELVSAALYKDGAWTNLY